MYFLITSCNLFHINFNPSAIKTWPSVEEKCTKFSGNKAAQSELSNYSCLKVFTFQSQYPIHFSTLSFSVLGIE